VTPGRCLAFGAQDVPQPSTNTSTLTQSTIYQAEYSPLQSLLGFTVLGQQLRDCLRCRRLPLLVASLDQSRQTLCKVKRFIVGLLFGYWPVPKHTHTHSHTQMNVDRNHGIDYRETSGIHTCFRRTNKTKR